MRLNTIAAVLLALLLTGTVSSGAASTLTISGTGTPSFVLDEPPWDTLGLFQGDSFTYEIVLDTSVAPSDVGSSTGPGFYGAVQSFIIDGVPFEPVTNPAPDNTDNRVLFFSARTYSADTWSSPVSTAHAVAAHHQSGQRRADGVLHFQRRHSRRAVLRIGTLLAGADRVVASERLPEL